MGRGGVMRTGVGAMLSVAVLVAGPTAPAGATPPELQAALANDTVECREVADRHGVTQIKCTDDQPPTPSTLPRERSLKKLRKLSGGKKVIAGMRSANPAAIVDVDARTSSTRTTRSAPAHWDQGTQGIPCVGDGKSGNRVQVVYAYRKGNDRSEDLAPLIRKWAAGTNAVFRVSAHRQGGRRHVRWVTTSDCVLQVMKVQINRESARSFNAMIGQLWKKGLKKPKRRYLTWAEASAYCGISTSKSDDRRGPRNDNKWGAIRTGIVVSHRSTLLGRHLA